MSATTEIWQPVRSGKGLKSFIARQLFSHLYYNPVVRPSLWLIGVFRIYFKKPSTFAVQGRTYTYFYRWYGKTYLHERSVEIPIIWERVQQHTGKRILEVGNVRSHYFPVKHDIVDKYEKAPGVLNVDVVNFRTHEPYDLIVSISTLEHVGWDEAPRNPEKPLVALENLTHALAPGGELIVTFPLGYNPAMDKLHKEKRLRFTEIFYLKRVANELGLLRWLRKLPRWLRWTNKWVEADWADVCNARYGHPFGGGNAIVIGVIKHNRDGTLNLPAEVHEDA